MMFWAVLGRNIVHHWKAFAFIGLALFAGIYILALKAEVRHQTKRADNAVEAKRLCAEGRKADRAAYARAQAEATRIATEAKRATEARYAAIQQEKDRALTLARADADARLRNWMRDKANQGRPNSPDLSGATGTPEATVAADPGAFLVGRSDLERCTAAYVNAEAWREWWNSISQTP
jgi:hypothetical protein